MAKTNKKNSAGININASQVRVGGDIVGGDKIVNQSIKQNNLVEAKKLAAEIIERLNSMENSEKHQKTELIQIMKEIQIDLQNNTPDSEPIINKLGNFQKLLSAVQGIGTTSIGLYTLAENLLRLIQR